MEEKYDNKYVFFVKLYIISNIECYASGNKMYSLIPVMWDAIIIESDKNSYKYKSVLTDKEYKAIEENDLKGSISIDTDSMVSLSYYDGEKILSRDEINNKLIEFNKNHSFGNDCVAYNSLINLYEKLPMERASYIISQIINSIGENETAKIFVGSLKIDYKLCDKDNILKRERR